MFHTRWGGREPKDQVHRIATRIIHQSRAPFEFERVIGYGSRSFITLVVQAHNRIVSFCLPHWYIVNLYEHIRNTRAKSKILGSKTWHGLTQPAGMFYFYSSSLFHQPSFPPVQVRRLLFLKFTCIHLPGGSSKRLGRL